MGNSQKNKEKRQSVPDNFDELLHIKNLTELLENKIMGMVEDEYSIKAESYSLDHPGNQKWGDYSSNIALVLAPKVKQSPMEIAKNMSYKLGEDSPKFKVGNKMYEIFEKVDYASPGFINFRLSREWLQNVLYMISMSDSGYKSSENLTQMPFGSGNLLDGKKVVIEYTDPNPFKIFHIGHLMSNCIGESISRLLEFQGSVIRRVNYQGDVGLHVSKSVWGMHRKFAKEKLSLERLQMKPLEERVVFLGESYALGATEYKNNESAQTEINNLNLQIFKAAQKRLEEEEGWEPKVTYPEYSEDFKHLVSDNEVKEYYKAGRSWSLELFEKIYRRLGTKFDGYYFESKVGEYGYRAVLDGLSGGVFEKDQGAVIFRGEKYGLHTRVFINSMGLPTYESKDLGLANMKYSDYSYNLSLIVTANEIDEYFKVVLKAMEFIYPELSKKTHHIGHGMMTLESGKMSSRTGKIIGGVELLDKVKESVESRMGESSVEFSEDELAAVSDQVAVGALKYDILKQSIGRDIVFSWERSLSLQGNTGPYLQYTYARASSVIEKSGTKASKLSAGNLGKSKNSVVKKWSPEEESVMRWIYRFPEATQRAAKEISPNTVCDYLSELAQRFNTFYASTPILNAEDTEIRAGRILLTKCVRDVMKTGLFLLGIESPNKM